MHYVSCFSVPSETFIYDLINNLEGDDGLDNYLLTHERELEQERPLSKIEVISEKVSFIKKVYSKFFNKWNIRNDKQVIKYIKSLKPDILHAHFGPNGIRIFNLLKKFNLEIPIVVSFHGTDTTMYPLKYKKYKKMVQRLTQNKNVICTFPSNFLKGEFCNNFEVFRPKVILVEVLGSSLKSISYNEVTK